MPRKKASGAGQAEPAMPASPATSVRETRSRNRNASFSSVATQATQPGGDAHDAKTSSSQTLGGRPSRAAKAKGLEKMKQITAPGTSHGRQTRSLSREVSEAAGSQLSRNSSIDRGESALGRRTRNSARQESSRRRTRHGSQVVEESREQSPEGDTITVQALPESSNSRRATRSHPQSPLEGSQTQAEEASLEHRGWHGAAFDVADFKGKKLEASYERGLIKIKAGVKTESIAPEETPTDAAESAVEISEPRPSGVEAEAPNNKDQENEQTGAPQQTVHLGAVPDVTPSPSPTPGRAPTSKKPKRPRSRNPFVPPAQAKRQRERRAQRDAERAAERAAKLAGEASGPRQSPSEQLLKESGNDGEPAEAKDDFVADPSEITMEMGEKEDLEGLILPQDEILALAGSPPEGAEHEQLLRDVSQELDIIHDPGIADDNQDQADEHDQDDDKDAPRVRLHFRASAEEDDDKSSAVDEDELRPPPPPAPPAAHKEQSDPASDPAKAYLSPSTRDTSRRTSPAARSALSPLVRDIPIYNPNHPPIGIEPPMPISDEDPKHTSENIANNLIHQFVASCQEPQQKKDEPKVYNSSKQSSEAVPGVPATAGPIEDTQDGDVQMTDSVPVDVHTSDKSGKSDVSTPSVSDEGQLGGSHNVSPPHVPEVTTDSLTVSKSPHAGNIQKEVEVTAQDTSKTPVTDTDTIMSGGNEPMVANSDVSHKTSGNEDTGVIQMPEAEEAHPRSPKDKASSPSIKRIHSIQMLLSPTDISPIPPRSSRPSGDMPNFSETLEEERVASHGSNATNKQATIEVNGNVELTSVEPMELDQAVDTQLAEDEKPLGPAQKQEQEEPNATTVSEEGATVDETPHHAEDDRVEKEPIVSKQLEPQGLHEPLYSESPIPTERSSSESKMVQSNLDLKIADYTPQHVQAANILMQLFGTATTPNEEEDAGDRIELEVENRAAPSQRVEREQTLTALERPQSQTITFEKTLPPGTRCTLCDMDLDTIIKAFIETGKFSALSEPTDKRILELHVESCADAAEDAHTSEEDTLVNTSNRSTPEAGIQPSGKILLPPLHPDRIPLSDSANWEQLLHRKFTDLAEYQKLLSSLTTNEEQTHVVEHLVFQMHHIQREFWAVNELYKEKRREETAEELRTGNIAGSRRKPQDQLSKKTNPQHTPLHPTSFDDIKICELADWQYDPHPKRRGNQEPHMRSGRTVTRNTASMGPNSRRLMIHPQYDNNKPKESGPTKTGRPRGRPPSKANAEGASSRATTQPLASGRNTPSASTPVTPSTTGPQHAFPPVTAAGQPAVVTDPPKRKRGRPKKNPDPPPSGSVSTTPNITVPQVAGVKRGRPPANTPSQSVLSPLSTRSETSASVSEDGMLVIAFTDAGNKLSQGILNGNVGSQGSPGQQDEGSLEQNGTRKRRRLSTRPNQPAGPLNPAQPGTVTMELPDGSVAAVPAPPAAPVVPVKRGPGRPKGSTNKPKVPKVLPPLAPSPVSGQQLPKATPQQQPKAPANFLPAPASTKRKLSTASPDSQHEGKRVRFKASANDPKERSATPTFATTTGNTAADSKAPTIQDPQDSSATAPPVRTRRPKGKRETFVYVDPDSQRKLTKEEEFRLAAEEAAKANEDGRRTRSRK